MCVVQKEIKVLLVGRATEGEVIQEHILGL